MKRQLTYLFLAACMILTRNNIIAQENKNATLNGSVVFSVNYPRENTYRWQVKKNNIEGFIDLADGGHYSGVKKSKLTISHVTAEMNGYQYHCIVNAVIRYTAPKQTKRGIKEEPAEYIDDNDKNEGKNDTLNVTIKLQRTGIIIAPDDPFNLSINVPSECTFKWFCDKGRGFSELSGQTDTSYTVSKVDCAMNQSRYFCQVTQGSSSLNTDTTTLNITGCITSSMPTYCIDDTITLNISTQGEKLRYQWCVRPYNTGDEFITIMPADSDRYEGMRSSALTIKGLTSAYNGGTYYCEVTDSQNRRLTEKDQYFTLDICGKIADHGDERFSLMGAYYTSLAGIKDDNTADLTQIYLRANIYRRPQGIDINSNRCRRLIWFRNFFLQITYSTNPDVTKYYNSQNNSFTKNDTAMFRSVNRLDLLKNATFNINFMTPVITYMLPAHRKHYGDAAHFYADPMVALLISNISDFSDSGKQMHVFSLQYGLNLGLRTECLKLNKLPLFLELQARMFWIDVLSNEKINPNLNYQQNSVDNYTPPRARDLTTDANQPYYNLDALLMYNTSTSSTSNVFLHFSFFTNSVHGDDRRVYNNYWQLQGGYALDINSFWDKLKKK